MPSTISAGTTAGTAIAIAGDTTGNLAFQTNGTTTAMTITTSQNVGIGTTSPNQTLQVNGNIMSGNGSAANPGYNFVASSATGMFTPDGFVVAFSANGTERMRIASDGTISTTIGSTLYGAYSARAWVNFNGTGAVAIRQSRNVSSITDNGTGDYTVNFTTSMPDNEYSVAGACVGSTTNAFSMICGAGGSVLNTGSVRFGIIASSTGTQQDYSHISLSIFR